MNVFVLLGFLLGLPFLLFFTYLALSSCMGDSIRARFAGVIILPHRTSYGSVYARNLGSGAGHAGWEQIEMEDMIDSDIDLDTSG